MENNSFRIEIKNSPFVLMGGYLKKFNFFSKQTLVNEDTSNKLIFCFTENTTKNEFINLLEESIRKQSLLSYLLLILKNKFGSFLTIFVSILIILFIVLLSIHGALSYEIFTGAKSDNIFNFQAIYVYGLISLLILVMLIFSPKIILGEFNNLLEWVDSVLSNNKQMTRRNKNLINLIVKKRNINTIEIVNPFIQGENSWIINQVIPSFKQAKIPVILFVKQDERQIALELFKKINFHQFFLVANESSSSKSNKEEIYATKLISSIEREYLSLLLFCSTLNLPKSWKNNNSHQVSTQFLEALNHLFGEKYLSQDLNFTVNKFVKRCLFDYGYLSTNNDYKEQRFIINKRVINEKITEKKFSSLNDEINSNYTSIVKELSDPYGILILLGIVTNGVEISPKRIELLEKFIDQCFATESYGLFAEYWDDISTIKASSNNLEFNIMNYLNSETLLKLSQCFANSGRYHNALSVYSIIEIIYPVKAAIGIADMHENLGEYDITLNTLYNTEKKWVISGIVENQDTLLELYLNIAWVIVGARFKKDKKNGYKYLKKVKDILDRLPNKTNYILFLSRYFNTIANYNEWDKNYKEAIANYEKALKLPGQFLRKSVLLGNRGTAKRFIGRNLEGKPIEQERYFISSMNDIKQSLEMKLEIGEKNQIHISCHSLSETLIELAVITKDGDKKRGFLLEAYKYANQGLKYLNEKKSTKKLGRLLVEVYISSLLLSKLGDKIDCNKPFKKLTEWYNKESIDSYDYYEVNGVLKRFNISI